MGKNQPKQDNLQSGEDPRPLDADAVITAASEEVRKILAKAFELLNEPLSAASGDTPRLFFPHGIERIYVKIEVKLPSSIIPAVEIEIAGAAGVKKPADGSQSSELAAPGETRA